MKKSMLFAAALLALGGCVSHNFSEGSRTTWRCDGDKEFSLRHVGDAVEIYASGQTHRLTPSGEGAYAADDIRYSVDHGRATLTGIYNGPFENCRRAGGMRLW